MFCRGPQCQVKSKQISSTSGNLEAFFFLGGCYMFIDMLRNVYPCVFKYTYIYIYVCVFECSYMVKYISNDVYLGSKTVPSGVFNLFGNVQPYLEIPHPISPTEWVSSGPL